MPNQSARSRGIIIGQMQTGSTNAITDVPGISVGHCTVETDQAHTGVTVLRPCTENPFFHQLPAAAFVWNGFGKTQGLVQLQELGTLETPIALTNTLNVGAVHDALTRYMIRRCAEDGFQLRSVNPIICECNDGTLNDIRHPAVTEHHVLRAISEASAAVEQGAVGAGRGMICHGLKGGIGTASRRFEVDGQTFTLGVLVLTNHGRMGDLTINGTPVGEQFLHTVSENPPDKGSCIVIAATDLALDARQLGRVIRRASVGLARLGSYMGGGSGEVFVGFSTRNPIDPRDTSCLHTAEAVRDSCLDLPFRAVAEATEEAVLNSMLCAHSLTGYTGKTIYSLADLL